MNVLVLCSSYPEENLKYGGMFFHVRNKYYIQKGIGVTVLCFKATHDYIIDGVQVIALKSYEMRKADYIVDILISHAPDMTFHYPFLLRYGFRFKRIVFVFHGFEVLNYRNFIPVDYAYISPDNWLKRLKFRFVDLLKRILWKCYIVFCIKKIHCVFVSAWMYDEFLKWIKLPPLVVNQLKGKSCVISNSVDISFETNSYDYDCEKLYDFITIRGNLDASKYGVDIVADLARNNSQYKFVVIGKGSFFDYNNKPENLLWIDEVLNHMDIISYLNKSRCALMPTRCDAQGLMMCEMATFGIPVITSDIQICKDVFREFENVDYIDNNNLNEDLSVYLDNLLAKISFKKHTRYFAKETCDLEVDLLNEII